MKIIPADNKLGRNYQPSGMVCQAQAGSCREYSVGGSQTRTLLNSAIGDRTQVANLVPAIFLVVFVVFTADLLTNLPKVAIAAILVYTGFGLIDMYNLIHTHDLWVFGCRECVKFIAEQGRTRKS